MSTKASSISDLPVIIGKIKEEKKYRLIQMGNYFLETLPTNLDNEQIASHENELNQMYINAREEKWGYNWENLLEYSLAITAELVEYIKDNPRIKRDAAFFQKAKKASKVLLAAEYL